MRQRSIFAAVKHIIFASLRYCLGKVKWYAMVEREMLDNQPLAKRKILLLCFGAAQLRETVSKWSCVWMDASSIASYAFLSPSDVEHETRSAV
ncbi:unnamed protein product [Litomosoides sigmodontis]|uniref:Uncharacterized protein n=1 Tax=Litomosoides sigmodontis TaxID=42156 RepID=A0A3P7K323_LITSI|nr:unnamed protein product [Litomosoides sigmodontis]